jgi:hypothetical protein
MLDTRNAARGLAAAVVALGAITAGAGVAIADDHLFDAAHSSGVDNRGFANPVAGNPSGVSGAAAQPGTVPGLGNPNSGSDTGTPAFDCVSLQERLAARSDGVGPSCG